MAHVTCRFVEDEPKPAQLPNTFWGWILPVWRASQQEVIAVAGTDGAVYLMMLKFGAPKTHDNTLQARMHT